MRTRKQLVLIGILSASGGAAMLACSDDVATARRDVAATAPESLVTGVASTSKWDGIMTKNGKPWCTVSLVKLDDDYYVSSAAHCFFRDANFTKGDISTKNFAVVFPKLNAGAAANGKLTFLYRSTDDTAFGGGGAGCGIDTTKVGDRSDLAFSRLEWQDRYGGPTAQELNDMPTPASAVATTGRLTTWGQNQSTANQNDFNNDWSYTPNNGTATTYQVDTEIWAQSALIAHIQRPGATDKNPKGVLHQGDSGGANRTSSNSLVGVNSYTAGLTKPGVANDYFRKICYSAIALLTKDIMKKVLEGNGYTGGGIFTSPNGLPNAVANKPQTQPIGGVVQCAFLSPPSPEDGVLMPASTPDDATASCCDCQSQDGGPPPDDGGPIDDGGASLDAGLPGDDAGLPGDDGGVITFDSGVPDTDAGIPGDDSGVTPTDDSGVPDTDAGIPGDDAGVTPTDDAGPIDDASTGLDGATSSEAGPIGDPTLGGASTRVGVFARRR